MNCENHFCIYWKEHHCVLERIELDEVGTCCTCILVDVDENQLEQARCRAREYEKMRI